MVLWSLMVLFFSVRVEPRKSKFFLKFNVSGVFFAFEHVFWLAFCVFWTAFKIKKLIESINGVNSTIFLFSRFHQISGCCFMSKHTKHHNLHGEVGNFFPPHHEGFPWPRTSKWTRIITTNTPGTLFHVVLRQFRRFWASLLAQKMGYKSVFC